MTSPPEFLDKQRCPHCGKMEVVPQTTDYQSEVRHDGRFYPIALTAVEIPVCAACGTRVFSEVLDRQIWEALRAQLHLLTPVQIRDSIERIGYTQKELSQCLGIAEATFSRWLGGVQIQTRAMDTLLRIFFGFPQVRDALEHPPAFADVPIVDFGRVSSES